MSNTPPPVASALNLHEDAIAAKNMQSFASSTLLLSLLSSGQSTGVFPATEPYWVPCPRRGYHVVLNCIPHACGDDKYALKEYY